MKSIFERRSIRKFTDRKISEEDLKSILTAAMCAPSANNSQPWEYIVVTERRLLDLITEAHPYTGMLKTADMAIIVCTDNSLSRSYWPQDCAASTQNILLEARELGIGSCWCGVYPVEKRVEAIRNLFDIPDSFTPFSVIALGYPAESKSANNRYIPQKIHTNKW